MLAIRKTRKKRGSHGFTLIELMVVISLLMTMALISIPTFVGSRGKASDANAKQALSNLMDKSAMIYYNRNGTFVGYNGTNALTGGPSDVTGGTEDADVYTPGVSVPSTTYSAITLSGTGNNYSVPPGSASPSVVTLSNKSGSGTFFCLRYDALVPATTYGHGADQVTAIQNCTNASW